MGALREKPVWRCITMGAWSLAVGGLMGMGSCSQPLETACNRDLPELISRVEKARPADRQLASLSASREASEWKEWRLWAEHSIARTQALVDRVEELPGGGVEEKRLVNDLTTELVTLHSYALSGDLANFNKTLEATRAKGAKIQALLCEQKTRGI